MPTPFGHYGHIVRVAGLFLAAGIAFVVVQGFLVPDDFGVYGHFRAGALGDNRDRPLVHAGRATCVECHPDVPEAAAGGAHAAIHCEACHGPQARHAGDPAIAPGRPDGATLCASCHARNVARPKSFPQVDEEDHAGGEDCLTCHAAHRPGLE
jgi:hypothetical protein